MVDIAKVIARIPTMDAQARLRLSKNVDDALKTTPEDEDARRVRAGLDAFDASVRKPRALKVTGLISWEPHKRGSFTSRGYHQGHEVGVIFKHANHTSAKKEVYSVEVNGQKLAQPFHHIDDARAAGEIAYTEQVEKRRQ